MSDTLPYYDLSRDARGVATLTIARAGKMNVLGTPVLDSLHDALRQLADDDSIRALVLTGSGEHAFVGGADLKEMVALEPASARRFISRLRDVCDAVRRFPVPVVARVRGWCLGGGLELAAACDMRIADASARFAMPEVKMGIPSVIHAALLPRLIGSARTRWLVLSAEVIDARRALDWGLVDAVVDAGALDDEIERTVAGIVSCGPQVMRAQKALLNAWDDMPLEDGIALSVDTFGDAFATGEPARFMGEFLARRQARRQ